MLNMNSQQENTKIKPQWDTTLYLLEWLNKKTDSTEY